MAEPVQPREGDVAFAVSVATLYDLTIGRVAWDVRLTRWSSPDKATLTLANRTPGGPVLNILPWDFYLTPPGHPLPPPILSISNDGISSMRVGGYIDLLEQASAPAARRRAQTRCGCTTRATVSGSSSTA